MFNVNPMNHVISGPQQNMMHSLMGNQIVNNATLFIFSPSVHNQQYKRSYVYNFSNPLCEQVVDVIRDGISGRGEINQMAFMEGSPDSNTAILPNANGIPINLQVFSELWSFLLVVDVQRGSTLTNSINQFTHTIPCDARFLYVGYCDNEPINPLNLGNGNTMNPQSVLIITHHSYIHKTMQLDAQRSIPIVNTITDIDIVPTDIVRQMGMGGPMLEYYAAPAKLIDSISPDMSMGANLMNLDGSMTAHLQNQRGNIPSVAALNSPKHHLRDIVRTLSDSYIHAADSAYSEFDTSPIYLSSVKSNLMSEHMPSSVAIAPIDPNSPITLGNVLSMYPNLVVNDCRVPATSQWDVVSQEAPNIVNIYSSLVASTLPSLLVANSISQIAFRYSSINIHNSFTTLDKDDVHELLDIATFVPLTPEMVKQKYLSLLRYLKKTMFPIIKAAGGDFDLIVHTSVAGKVIASLKFYNYPSISIDGAYYESYNSLGGIMSPIVTTNEEFIHNASNLANMIHQVSPQ